MVSNHIRLMAAVTALLSDAAIAVGSGYSFEDASSIGFVAALSSLGPLLGETGGVIVEHILGIEIAPGLLEGVGVLIEQAAALDLLGFVAVASGTFLLLCAFDSARRKHADN